MPGAIRTDDLPRLRTILNGRARAICRHGPDLNGPESPFGYLQIARLGSLWLNPGSVSPSSY